jgi:Uma2 family endonuclease
MVAFGIPFLARFHFLFLLMNATLPGMGIGRTNPTLDKTGKRGFAALRYTYSQLCAEFPETNLPTELWEGELIKSPAPSFHHQKVALRFYKALDSWVASRQLGEVVTAPIDMVLSEHQTTQPDVAFISQSRLTIVQDAIHGAADLVAEVISLGSRTRDRIEKRDLYEQFGVKEYWIIDPEIGGADILYSEKGVFQLAVRCGPSESARSRLLPGFQITMQQLFHGP